MCRPGSLHPCYRDHLRSRKRYLVCRRRGAAWCRLVQGKARGTSCIAPRWPSFHIPRQIAYHFDVSARVRVSMKDRDVLIRALARHASRLRLIMLLREFSRMVCAILGALVLYQIVAASITAPAAVD